MGLGRAGQVREGVLHECHLSAYRVAWVGIHTKLRAYGHLCLENLRAAAMTLIAFDFRVGPAKCGMHAALLLLQVCGAPGLGDPLRSVQCHAQQSVPCFLNPDFP